MTTPEATAHNELGMIDNDAQKQEQSDPTPGEETTARTPGEREHADLPVAGVILVVHGIGDHTGTNILEGAGRGLIQFDGVHSKQITLPNYPRVREQDPVPIALRIIDNDGRCHLLVPLVWSGIRPRLFDRARLITSGRTGIVGQISGSLIFLMSSWLDALRCIPRAEGLAFRTFVTVAVLTYIAAGAAIVGFIFYLMVHVPLWQTTIKSVYGLWPGLLFLAFAVALLRTQIRTWFRLWDFLGDIASYVGNEKLRTSTESTMQAIVENVMSLAPDARVVLVGHSLGSVLVSRCLQALRRGNVRDGRVLLVTLGSPLRYLSHIFPRVIRSPEQLLTTYQQGGIVFAWTNFWRDADQVGRALRVQSQPEFAESSLGDGPHANYWQDPRLWERILRCIRWSSQTEPDVLKFICSSSALYVEDFEVQALAMKPGISFRIVVQTTVAFALLWMSARTQFSANLTTPALCAECGLAISAAGLVAINTVILVKQGDARTRVSWDHLWHPWALLVGKFWVIFVVLLGTLEWWASR